jgi:hypothetical protein
LPSIALMLLRAYAVSVARAVRAFATAKDTPFLSDAIAKAAIGKDAEVATSFVSAFAAIVHQKRVRVSNVTLLAETTGLSLVRDMKHDIALRYSVGGAESAVMEVVPQHYNRALVEIQRQPETYLPGRALAHASGHYLAAIDEEAKAVKAEKRKAMEEEDLRAATEGGAAGGAPAQARRKTTPRGRAVYDSAVYTAYVRVEPVHLLMLSDFCYAHDTAAGVWRAPKSSSVLAGGKYGWSSPLFSTFRLTTDAGRVRQAGGLADPGPSSFASTLRDRLSITIVHLPMVPMALDDEAAWSKAVTLPEHEKALESSDLRQWLHYLAHTSLKDGKVKMPTELRAYPIFRKSAEMAENLLGTTAFSFSVKEMSDLTLHYDKELEEAREETLKERAAAAEREAAAAEALKKERAAAAEREAAAAEREAALLSELERQKKPASAAS